MLKLAISPCPNDTFAFFDLIAKEKEFELTLDDVETLNRRAERGEAEITKLSVAAFGRVRERYGLLRAGGAAGFGVGPLLVAQALREPGGRIAIPGERTTAALLLRLVGRFETTPMRFDRIEEAVARGEVEAGVLIHEGRFTFRDKGLVQLADLGELWERRFGLPLPLGAIAIRRDLGAETARRVDARIRLSVERALADPEASRAFVRQHARELASDVIRRHIELYVNDYTLALDERPVRALLDFGVSEGFFPPGSGPIFA